MRTPLLASALVAGMMAAAGAVQAMDCARAASKIERMICDDSGLRRGDAEMGEAYAHILKSADNAEIRAMLVTSQQRWIAARDRRLGRFDETDAAGILLQAMRDRTRQLAETVGTPAVPRLVQIAMAQRSANARSTGGRFAGFETSCDFLPQAGRFDYGCLGTHHFQNKARVCSTTIDWASGSVSQSREVADVVDGRLRLAASCALGGAGDSPCPEDGDAGAGGGHWTLHTGSASAAPPDHPLPKLDAELVDDDAGPWLQACLSESGFPQARSGDTTAPKPP